MDYKNLTTQSPLVSVICLCHNHAPYVRAALQSVLAQSYALVELIVVDDASSDGSPSVIRQFVREHPRVAALFNGKNRGNCRSFNRALRQARGELIIDLAADDVLRPERIARQVEGFRSAGETVGVLFHNVRYIDADGQPQGTYFPADEQGKTTVSVPQGDLFAALLRHRPVCAPSMMMRRAVLDGMGGYDEALAYEDFDFWVRSSRQWAYRYQDEILTEKRVLGHSLGSRFYRVRNELLPTAFIVCQKAKHLTQTPEEHAALAFRVRYFVRQCWYTHHFGLAREFARLLETIDPLTRLVLQACRWHVPIHAAYLVYLRRKLEPQGLTPTPLRRGEGL